jgi:competence protein ComEC
VLLLVVFCLIFSNYKIIYDVGFIYSIVTVGGIILCNDFINCDNKFISSFRLCLVAFIFSMPITLYNFYEVNLFSIFYNMIFVPYVSIIVYPLSLISFIIPVFNNLFSVSIDVLESLSLLLCDFKVFVLYLDFNIYEVILFCVVSYFVFCNI